jgi:hypothetical protein
MIITPKLHSGFYFQNTVDEIRGLSTSGTPAFADGKWGRALENSGAAWAGIEVGTVSSYNYMHQTAKGAVSFWMKLNNHTSSSAQVIFTNTRFSTFDKGFWIIYENRQLTGNDPFGDPWSTRTTRSIRFNIASGDGNPVWLIETGPIIDNNDWNHITISFQINAVSDVWVNGVKITPEHTKTTRPVQTGDASRVAKIGQRQTANDFTLLGQLNRLYMFTDLIGEADAQRLYSDMHPLNA